MLRYLALPLLVASMASPVAAQTTTSCYWVGNVWTCNQNSPPPQINWGTLRSPSDVGSSAMDAFRQGQEIGERARRAQLERERLQAETEMYRAQAEAARAAIQPPARAKWESLLDPFESVSGSAPQTQTPASDYTAAWLAAAQPRMGLYPDFAEKVFAPEVPISPDMVRLMTGSTMAADIAYYLATHRAEATAISQMPLLEAARAIDRIESELKSKPGN